MKLFFTFLLTIFLTSCSTVDLTQYSMNTPQLDLFDFFTGQSKGWGIVQDRSGQLTRQFTVDITGTTTDGNTLSLYEKFDWSDGEQTTRTWIISKTGAHSYTGTAADVSKAADGLLYGNVLNWKYLLNLKVDGTTWKIKFDDWMFLVNKKMLLNKATMSKFGLKIGEVTIVFQK